MKILHIITSLKIGGAESALYNYLATCKNKQNHYVASFYDGPNVKKIKKLGIQTFYISGKFYKYDLFLYLRLKKIIKKIKPNIIHSSLWSANFISRIIAKKMNIPIICDLHNEFSHNGKIRNFLEKLVIFKANKYVAVSDSTQNSFIDFIKKNFKKNKQHKLISKIIKIPNGININTVQQEAFKSNFSKININLKQDDFVFGTVGRLEPVKNHELLIKSFNQLLKQTKKTNIKLCIIGDGSQRKNLEKLTKHLNITDSVLLPGQQNNCHKFYPIFDCFVLSSKSEGMPISLLEALCFGLPIILTNDNKKHDVIINYKNGLLVPCNDKLELTKAMNKILNSQELRDTIKSNNLKLIKNKFDIKRVCDALDVLYCNITTK